jgi:uncharacterized protein YbbK (DUF523 family)
MYLISACLIGENVTYDGSNNYHSVAKELYDKGRVIPVCPEVFGGLPTPRVPAEIVGDNVITKHGVDVTKYFQRGALKTLQIAKENHVTLAILQARSPSCGSKQVYDGTFSGQLIEGEGTTTKRLREHGITVITIDEFVENYYGND